MTTSHYVGLFAGYGAATALIWLIWFLARGSIAAAESVRLQRPYLQLGLYFLAAAAVLLVGQAYIAKMLLPERDAIARLLNQVLIFSPILVLLAASRRPLQSAYLGIGQAPGGLTSGAVAAGLAVFAYLVARGKEASLLTAFGQLPSTDDGVLALQILLEDVAIGAGLARVAAAANEHVAVVLVAALFALAHIPSLLATGVTVGELATLGLDTVLGVVVGGAIIATRSIWWVIPIHVSMDLMQFIQDKL